VKPLDDSVLASLERIALAVQVRGIGLFKTHSRRWTLRTNERTNEGRRRVKGLPGGAVSRTSDSVGRAVVPRSGGRAKATQRSRWKQWRSRWERRRQWSRGQQQRSSPAQIPPQLRTIGLGSARAYRCSRCNVCLPALVKRAGLGLDSQCSAGVLPLAAVARWIEHLSSDEPDRCPVGPRVRVRANTTQVRW